MKIITKNYLTFTNTLVKSACNKVKNNIDMIAHSRKMVVLYKKILNR